MSKEFSFGTGSCECKEQVAQDFSKLNSQITELMKEVAHLTGRISTLETLISDHICYLMGRSKKRNP
jgi:hypothetical protein